MNKIQWAFKKIIININLHLPNPYNLIFQGPNPQTELKSILSQSTDLFNGHTKYYLNIHLTCPKYTLYNNQHNTHFSLKNNYIMARHHKSEK